MVQGSDGNFYGTTSEGGIDAPWGHGTLFKIGPSGAFTNLYFFTGTNDGANPNDLVQGSDGNFYGTTSGGGVNGYGTVFKISSAGVFTSLYFFNDDLSYPDNAAPNGLVQGSDGNFYGTTMYGGLPDQGTVFRISLGLPPLPAFLTGDGTFGVQSNRFGFSLVGVSGSSVVVQATTNLADPNWLALATNTFYGGAFYFSDPDWTNYPSRFYRLRTQ
jgi:uncharacterized repeat protein (TIGR03803 family)